ncbi:LOW QUALITY PROTEIN: Phosphoglycerate kinase 1, partial [Galemys pyrenaicus]
SQDVISNKTTQYRVDAQGKCIVKSLSFNIPMKNNPIKTTRGIGLPFQVLNSAWTLAPTTIAALGVSLRSLGDVYEPGGFLMSIDLNYFAKALKSPKQHFLATGPRAKVLSNMDIGILMRMLRLTKLCGIWHDSDWISLNCGPENSEKNVEALAGANGIVYYVWVCLSGKCLHELPKLLMDEVLKSTSRGCATITGGGDTATCCHKWST